MHGSWEGGWRRQRKSSGDRHPEGGSCSACGVPALWKRVGPRGWGRSSRVGLKIVGFRDSRVAIRYGMIETADRDQTTATCRGSHAKEDLLIAGVVFSRALPQPLRNGPASRGPSARIRRPRSRQRPTNCELLTELCRGRSLPSPRGLQRPGYGCMACNKFHNIKFLAACMNKVELPLGMLLMQVAVHLKSCAAVRATFDHSKLFYSTAVIGSGVGPQRLDHKPAISDLGRR